MIFKRIFKRILYIIFREMIFREKLIVNLLVKDFIIKEIYNY